MTCRPVRRSLRPEKQSEGHYSGRAPLGVPCIEKSCQAKNEQKTKKLRRKQAGAVSICQVHYSQAASISAYATAAEHHAFSLTPQNSAAYIGRIPFPPTEMDH